MENLKVERVTIKAFIIEDRKELTFTIFKDGKGGPIISDGDLENAKKRFKEALHLCCAVENLTTFYEAVKNAENKADQSDTLGMKNEAEIEFVNLELAA